MNVRPWVLALLGLVGAAAAVLSFSALYELALMCEFHPRVAWLLPVLLDAGAGAATFVWLGPGVLAVARDYARSLALTLLGGSVVGNVGSHVLQSRGFEPGGPVPAPWWVITAVSAAAPAVLGAVGHLYALAGRGVDTPDPEPVEEEELSAIEGDTGVPVEAVRRPMFVYRLLDESGALLYVGVSNMLRARLRKHRDTKPWWSDVTAIRVEQYRTRSEALAVERSAIATEEPVHNLHPGHFDESPAEEPVPAGPQVSGPVHQVLDHVDPDRRQDRSQTVLTDVAVWEVREEFQRTGNWPSRNEVMRRFRCGTGRSSKILAEAQALEASPS